MSGATESNKLFDELIRRGFSTSDIEKIAYKNILRVMNEAGL